METKKVTTEVKTTSKIRVVRSVITTVIGTILLLASIGLYLSSYLGFLEAKFTFIQLLPVMLLGWVFLMSKDSILEGITMGIFKLKDKDEKPR